MAKDTYNHFDKVSKKLSNSELEYRIQNTDHFQHAAVISARNELIRRGEQDLPPVPDVENLGQLTEEEKEELSAFEEKVKGRSATFMERLLAYIIDTFICLVAFIVLYGLFYAFQLSYVALWLINKNYVQLIFILSYYVFWETSSFQATPGKRILKIKVVDQNGNRIEGVHAGLRYFSKFLSFITFLIGYLMMFFDLKKRTLHDRITKTHVIKPKAASYLPDEDIVLLDEGL